MNMNKTETYLDIFLDKSYIPFVCLYLNWNVIKGILTNCFIFFNIDETIKEIISGRLYFIVFICFLLYFIKNYKKYLKSAKLCITIIICYMLFQYSVSVNNIDNETIKDLFQVLSLNFILIILLLYGIKDINAFIEHLRPYCFIAVFYALSELLKYSVTKQYDMTFSYTLLIPMLICLIFAIYESKHFYLVIFLFLEIINLICGSRGSILCHLICFLLCMFFYSNKTRFIKWIFSFTLILFIVLCFSPLITNYLQSHFSNSRTVNLIISGEFVSHSSGRDEIYAKAWNYFLDNPIRFSGFYSDRLLLNQNHNKGFPYGSYAHNFILEILLQFGIFAIPFIIYFFYKTCRIIKILKKDMDWANKAFFIISFSFFLGQLSVSSSYLISPAFGLFVGFLFRYTRQRNEINKIQRELV